MQLFIRIEMDYYLVSTNLIVAMKRLLSWLRGNLIVVLQQLDDPFESSL